MQGCWALLNAAACFHVQNDPGLHRLTGPTAWPTNSSTVPDGWKAAGMCVSNYIKAIFTPNLHLSSFCDLEHCALWCFWLRETSEPASRWILFLLICVFDDVSVETCSLWL